VNVHRYCHARRDPAEYAEHTERFVAVAAQTPSSQTGRELQQNDTHADQVAAVNPHESLGHDGANAQKLCWRIPKPMLNPS
jgi:hypothetical protein